MNETIIMIHGMMTGPWCWENYRQFFEEKGYRCITPTLRFHDMDSDSIPDPQLGNVSLLDYLDDLEKEIRGLDALPIIIGHSMGGLITQILASRGLAKAAVLLTPAPPSRVLILKYSAIRSFLPVIMRWGFWRKPFRSSFEGVVYSTLHLMPADEQRKIYSQMVYESGRSLFQIGFWFLDRSKASKVDDAKVKCPVLAISGKQDRIVSTSSVRKIAAKYKTVSTYREFANHAHWVIGEPGWQDIASYILDWLSYELEERK